MRKTPIEPTLVRIEPVQEQETNTVVPSRSSTQNAPEENITEGESGGRCQSMLLLLCDTISHVVS
jgi:hypothetical protein